MHHQKLLTALQSFTRDTDNLKIICSKYKPNCVQKSNRLQGTYRFINTNIYAIIKLILNNIINNNLKENKYFAVIIGWPRYLYLDMDIYNSNINFFISSNDISYIFNFILTKLINKYSHKHLYIYNCTRKLNSKKTKFSFHLIYNDILLNKKQLLNTINNIKSTLLTMSETMQNKNMHDKLITIKKYIDMEVYKDVQQWKLPFNHSKNINSTKSPYENNYPTLFMNDLKINYLMPINILHKNYKQYLYEKQLHNDSTQILRQINYQTNHFQLLKKNLNKYQPKSKNINLEIIRLKEPKQFYAQNIYCFFKKSLHKKNRTIITFHNDFIQFYCLDKACRININYNCSYYINMHKKLLYPWLYQNINNNIYFKQQMEKTLLQSLSIKKIGFSNSTISFNIITKLILNLTDKKTIKIVNNKYYFITTSLKCIKCDNQKLRLIKKHNNIIIVCSICLMQ